MQCGDLFLRRGDAHLVGERIGREEAEHGVEGVDECVTDAALDLEGLDDHAAGTVDGLHAGVGPEGAGVWQHLGVDGALAVEVAEVERDVRGERRAEEAGEPPAWL